VPTETTSAFRGALANGWLWLAIATSAALQVAPLGGTPVARRRRR